MNARDLMHTAVSALRAHRFRSFLTMTSLVIGSAAIVLMTSLAKSGLSTLRADIEALGGARLILVTPRSPERKVDKASLAPGQLTEADAHAIARVPFVEAQCRFSVEPDLELQGARGRIVNADVVTASPSCVEALGFRVARGRMFTAAERARDARVCLLGPATATALFAARDILGERAIVGHTACRIIGRLDAYAYKSIDLGFDGSNFILRPFSEEESQIEDHSGSMLMLRTDSPRHNDPVKRIVNTLLETRHYGVDDYQIWDFARVLASYDKFFLVTQILVSLLAGISLVVGGIGIMNMMLVSVTERRSEIGVRRALGATRAAIERQFLAESTVLAALGGVLGVGLGLGSFSVASALMHRALPAWIQSPSGLSVLAALLSALSLGVGFGLLPARTAAKLDPVTAMRG